MALTNEQAKAQLQQEQKNLWATGSMTGAVNPAGNALAAVKPDSPILKGTPSVITSSEAKNDLASKTSELDALAKASKDQATQRLASQQQAGQPAGLQYPEFPKAEGKTLQEQAQGNIDVYKSALDRINTKAAEDSAQFKSRLDSLALGTYALSPFEQSQIDAIQNQYQAMIEDAKRQSEDLANAQRVAAGRHGGIRSVEMETGLVHSAIQAGAAKVNTLKSQMISAMTEAQTAIQEKDYKRLQDAYDRIQQTKKDQSDAILATYNQAKDAMEAAKADHAEKVEAAKFDFEKRKYMEQPLRESDKSVLDYVLELKKKYPDVDISPDDSIATVTNKVKASDTYIAEMAKMAAETAKAKAEAGKVTVDELDKPLSTLDLMRYPGNLPAGTTMRQVMAMGLSPNVTEMSAAQSASFMAITGRIDSSKELQNINNMEVQAKIADQIIADPNKATNQLASVYSLVKNLDPTSAVREGELKLSFDTGSFIDKMENAVIKLGKGEVIRPELAKELALKTKELLDAYRTLQDKKVRGYVAQAKGVGIDGQVIDYFANSGYAVPSDVLSAKFGVPAKDIDEAVKNMGFTETYNFLKSPKAEGGAGAAETKQTSAADAKKMAAAIGQFESGGNYLAKGPVVASGQYKGERAIGKYQIMPGNVPSWTKEALGKSMTPDEFLNDPKAQDAVAEYRMAKLVGQGYGVEDIASIWFSGRPVSKAGNSKDVLGTSTPQYVRNIRANYDKLG